jgi:hypothetical protein
MRGGFIFDETGVSLRDLTSIDLSQPLLILFLLFWAFLALSGILTTVFTKTKAGDAFNRFKSRIRETFHKRHSHQE